MKEFTTAVVEQAEQEEFGEIAPTEFKVDDRVCYAYRPEEGQIIMLFAMTSKRQSRPEQMAGIINFLDSTLDDNSREYITDRLLDRKDPFGFREIDAISRFLVEEWTARPTKSPSGSTPSRPRTGRKSTPTT